MFEDATFSSRSILPSQTPKWMLATLSLNLTLLAALIVLPLLHPDRLPPALLARTLFAPPAPQTTAQPSHRQPQAATTISLRNPFLPPISGPPVIDRTPDPASPGNDAPFSPNAIPGPDGPSGLSTTVFHSDPPPAVRADPAQPKTLHLSTVSESLLLYKPAPVYPPLALATHTSGVVVLAATISTTGTIENLQVRSGSPMLTGAAIAAVRQWRYRPFLLNNQPVEVETTIRVVFSLTSH